MKAAPLADLLRLIRVVEDEAVDDFINNHHNPIIAEKNRDIADLQERVEQLLKELG